jgi:selenium metabolism protein YedF
VRERRDTLYIINTDLFGRGDDGLGRQLMAKFVLQLSQQTPKPHAIVFYNAGVKLLARSSPCADGFKALEHEGVDLIACGTCVDFFTLRDQIVAGRVSDMREIVATMNASATVITV